MAAKRTAKKAPAKKAKTTARKPRAPKAPTTARKEPSPSEHLDVAAVDGLAPSNDGDDFAWWPIERVKPWVDNPRKNARAVPKIADSLRRFGWGRPLIVNMHPSCEGELIVGHTAWLAALELGLDRVPVRIRRMDPDAAHALAIADNKLGEISSWDPEALGRIVGGNAISTRDIEIAGFSAAELARLNGGAANDAGAPEAPADPVSRPGDLWILGSHRLVCGDSTNAEDVALALGGEAPHLMVTDPPYGVNYAPEWRVKPAESGALAYADRRVGKVQNDDRADWTEAWQLAPSAVCYVWHAPGPLCMTVGRSLESATFELRPLIIWAKRHFPIGRGHYHIRNENCWYGVRKGKGAQWIGGRQQTTVWDDITLDANVDGGHSTQKPIECMARPIRNHKGDVFDPFLGSGTTIVAAEQLERRCFGLEIHPPYCDVIVERWQKLTGKKAKRVKAKGAA